MNADMESLRSIARRERHNGNEELAAIIERTADKVERLRDLLRHADAMVIWELTGTRPGFQEEIEEALGIK
jgi:hypothetical protein